MVRSGVEVLSSLCFLPVLCRPKRVWPEAAALQAQVHEHVWQLQVLLSQRIHASAGRFLLKYVKNLNCFISALGLTVYERLPGGNKIVSYGLHGDFFKAKFESIF